MNQTAAPRIADAEVHAIELAVGYQLTRIEKRNLSEALAAFLRARVPPASETPYCAHAFNACRDLVLKGRE